MANTNVTKQTDEQGWRASQWQEPVSRNLADLTDEAHRITSQARRCFLEDRFYSAAGHMATLRRLMNTYSLHDIARLPKDRSSL